MLVERLDKVKKVASASKWGRFVRQPYKYLNAILFRELVYKRTKVEKEVRSTTFFDANMHLLLPSSTDIYLTGGKSHDSEIRLARYLIDTLENGDSFVDVGAHYGYFSLLGSKLVGNNGSVHSFEASPTTYRMLHKNTNGHTNITSHNVAVSDELSELVFYEFPNLYSEYNALNVDQYKEEKWFSENKPKEISIKSILLDSFLNENKVLPKIIKIDVEGAEYKVINGLKGYLDKNDPFVIIEYLSEKRGNREHKQAEGLLNALGYTPHIINRSGGLRLLESVSCYLTDNALESDNIVFVKTIS